MNPTLLGLVALALVATSPPDASTPRVVVTQPDESKFPEITVYYELKRLDGTFVLDARRDDFKVFEDGRDRPILGFEAPQATETRPMTLVLVVDRSVSMANDDRIGILKRSVREFLEGMPRGSTVAVLSFCDTNELICGFTTDYTKAMTALDALDLDPGTLIEDPDPAPIEPRRRGRARPRTPSMIRVGQTFYYDAVAAALELLGRQSGRRAVLALTDGEDTGSVHANLDGVIRQARKLGLPVHTLGLGDEKEIAVADLARLANETRGQHYLARDADQLRRIYEEIVRRAGNSYGLTYQTDRKIPDGTLRPIRIVYQAGAQAAAQAGETAIFVRGMVVPAAGWSGLYLMLLGLLIVLAKLPHLKT